MYAYQVDENDTLTAVDESWLRFARENEASHLTRELVVGRPIWQFVTGAETRHLYGSLFERARSTGSVRRIPFRCDSPERRRFMELDIVAAASGALELQSRIVREEARAAVALLRPTAERSKATVDVCSWCKRIHADGARWLEVEEAIDQLDLFGATLPELNHKTCPECAKHVREWMRNPESRPRC